jgi:hypothetical protein
MALDLEILSPTDRPALLGITAPDLLEYATGVLDQLGFKVHSAPNHDEFLERFGRVQYFVALLEDNFCEVPPEDNVALTTLQSMPMILRRNTTILLLGDAFQTLDPLQAFQQSVHAVINRADADKLVLIIQQVVSDSSIFLQAFRDVQTRIAQGKG